MERAAELSKTLQTLGPVSITLDGWSRFVWPSFAKYYILCTFRADRKAFIGVTCHWVTEDMVLKSATLRAMALEVVCSDKWEVPREKADMILKFIADTMSKFGITSSL